MLRRLILLGFVLAWGVMVGLPHTPMASTPVAEAAIQNVSYTSSPGLFFGSSPTSVSDTITVAETGAITNVTVDLNISHTWVGDVVVDVTHVPTGTTISLINQIGVPAAGPEGCSSNNIVVTLDDGAAAVISDYELDPNCTNSGAAGPTGSWQPMQPLSGLAGLDLSGNWRLDVSDAVPAFDDGTLNSWTLNFTYDDGVVGAGAGAVNYNKISQVRVTAPGTPIYESAGGNVVRSGGGSEIWIPNPTAHNPYEDVYDVISSVDVDGTTWVEIFIGDASDYVWIPLGPNAQIIN